MADPTPMTLAEAARALAGISPYLPPGMAEILNQALQAALQFSGERGSLEVQLAAAREQLASTQAAGEAATQRVAGLRQYVENLQREQQHEEERLRQIKEAVASHAARRDTLDKLRADILAYVEGLR